MLLPSDIHVLSAESVFKRQALGSHFSKNLTWSNETTGKKIEFYLIRPMKCRFHYKIRISPDTTSKIQVLLKSQISHDATNKRRFDIVRCTNNRFHMTRLI